MGEPAFLSEEFSNNLDPDIEVVTTSGYGKNGALCILQRSVRPQVICLTSIGKRKNSRLYCVSNFPCH